MNVKHQLQKIKLIISDVDGVLTDGTVLKGGGNMELKRFCVQDGTAVAMVKEAGFDLAFISGRYSEATEIRMKELKVSDVYNGTLNKLVPYRELKTKYQSINPPCKKCKKRMKSKGKNQGYQCIKCGSKSSSKKIIKLPRLISKTLYIPTISAHRHLTRPKQRLRTINQKNQFSKKIQWITSF